MKLGFPTRHRQRGVSAIEFAMVFPVFFLILYAIITYGLIFAAQQSLTLAATEGARAALVYQAVTAVSGQTSQQTALDARATFACDTALQLVGWLSSGPVTCAQVPQTSCGSNGGMYCVQVTLTYPYGTRPLIPMLPLTSLVLPTSLTSSATVQIDPVNIL